MEPPIGDRSRKPWPWWNYPFLALGFGMLVVWLGRGFVWLIQGEGKKFDTLRRFALLFVDTVVEYWPAVLGTAAVIYTVILAVLRLRSVRPNRSATIPDR